MSSHSNVTVAVVAACLAMTTLADAQARKEQPARKIAVVAVRDSGLFTLCPVIGRNVIESNVSNAGMRAPVTVSYPVTGRQVLVFHFDDRINGRAYLPVATAQATPPAATTPDVEGKAELEASIRALKEYAVVDSPSAADFVLVVDSTYGYAPRGLSSIDGVVEWRIDRNGPAAWRHVSLAILVPSADYRDHATDAVALTAAAAWEGMTFSQFERKDRAPGVTPASLKALVDQLSGKGRQQPAYLPVCAVNGGAPY